MLKFIVTGLACACCICGAYAATPNQKTDATAANAKTIGVAGRILIDAARFDDDITPINSGMEFRKVWLKLHGTVTNNWAYTVQYDFSHNSPSAKNLYIGWQGLDNANVYLGQFKAFFGLSGSTSGKYLTFMERPAMSVFEPGYRIGAGYKWAGSHTTFAASVYGNAIGQGTQDDGLVNYGSRFTFAPFNSAGNVLHLGVAIAIENHDDTHRFGFSQRPPAHMAPKLVGTSITNVDNARNIGAELAWVAGPFSVQSEYESSTLTRTNGFDNVTFSGYYAQASVFLTGESRPYSNGSFGHVTPLSSSGAWQLAVRTGRLNLNDGAIIGGKMKTVALGVNYYVNSHVRFMVNYIRTEVNHGGTIDKPVILQLRAQLDF